MDSPAKPPPIVVGVQGFDAHRRGGDGADWARLCRLPPFQLFVESLLPGQDLPSDQQALLVVKSARASGEDGQLLDAYIAWHAASGKWPNETPFGDPIQ